MYWSCSSRRGLVLTEASIDVESAEALKELERVCESARIEMEDWDGKLEKSVQGLQ